MNIGWRKMDNDSPVQTAFHFIYASLKGDIDTAAKIATMVAEFRPGEIFGFLMTVGGSIDAHSNQIEMEYPPYREYKEYVCAKLMKGTLSNYYYISGRKE